MQQLQTKNKKMTSRRAVAPVIATLLLVAIAVVGGSIIFVFSQGFFSSAQVSGAPQIESIEIVGYDASDVENILLHDGIFTDGNATNAEYDGISIANGGEGILQSERVGVYLQNQSAQRVTLLHLTLAGNEYFFFASGATNLVTAPLDGSEDGIYHIVKQGVLGTTPGPAILHDGDIPTMEAGEEVTILMTLSTQMSSGRDAQFKIETANGAVFVGTIIAGQQSG